MRIRRDLNHVFNTKPNDMAVTLLIYSVIEVRFSKISFIHDFNHKRECGNGIPLSRNL